MKRSSLGSLSNHHHTLTWGPTASPMRRHSHPCLRAICCLAVQRPPSPVRERAALQGQQGWKLLPLLFLGAPRSYRLMILEWAGSMPDQKVVRRADLVGARLRVTFEIS